MLGRFLVTYLLKKAIRIHPNCKFLYKYTDTPVWIYWKTSAEGVDHFKFDVNDLLALLENEMENLHIGLEGNTWADQSRKELEQQIPSLEARILGHRHRR